MKLHRLLGILTVLQRHRRTTVTALSEQFEVSTRTVLRDLDTLGEAGFPIVTTQGRGGGVALMDGFSLDGTVLTEGELSAILSGLSSLDSVSQTSHTHSLRQKLGANHDEPHISIDLGAFHTDSLTHKIAQIEDAIRTCRTLAFHYYYEKGHEDKEVEPLKIVYRWSSWYIFGFCPARNDFRMYKLDRVSSLHITDTPFIPREIPPERLQFGSNMTDHLIVSAIYAPQTMYRVIEQYGLREDMYTDEEGLHADIGFSTWGQALSWFLSFGTQVTVLSPAEFVMLYLDEVQKILEKYQI